MVAGQPEPDPQKKKKKIISQEHDKPGLISK
jgi:hypothetical protein